MKKLFVLILTLSIILSLASCGGGNSGNAETSKNTGDVTTEKKELPDVTVWASGSQNVSDCMTKLIDTYNTKEDRTANISMQFLMSGSGDEGLAARVIAAYKTQNKSDKFDIVIDNTSALVSIMDKAESDDIFVDMDFESIKNWDSVLLKPSQGQEKFVSYRGTTVVFAYDTERVKNLPTTWDELTQWIEDNPGRFAYSSDGGAADAFKRTAIYHLIDDDSARTSSDEKWVEQWDKGIQWLSDIHPYLYASGGSVVYPNKNQGSLDLLIGQEVDIIPAWADQVLQNVENGILPKTTAMMQLSDDALSGTEASVAITSLCEAPENCYDFIDFMISAEGQKICIETMYAIPVIDFSLIDSPQIELIKDLNPDNFSILSIGDLDTKLKERWERDILTLG